MFGTSDVVKKSQELWENRRDGKRRHREWSKDFEAKSSGYYICPNCKAEIRQPPGSSYSLVICPNCGALMRKK